MSEGRSHLVLSHLIVHPITPHPINVLDYVTIENLEVAIP